MRLRSKIASEYLAVPPSLPASPSREREALEPKDRAGSNAQAGTNRVLQAWLLATRRWLSLVKGGSGVGGMPGTKGNRLSVS